MKLYFSPLACSLATRIALHEAKAEVEFIEIDPPTKKTRDGKDFREVYALGLVPALALDDGTLLTENAAILQWVADRFASGVLAPSDALGRSRLHQWLCYVGTELHKGLFVPVLDKKAPPAVKEYALAKAPSRLGFVDDHLRDREYLLDRFTVADGYLFTVLNWAQVTPISLAAYPAITAFMTRVGARPSVARAVEEEKRLYLEEIQRHSSSRNDTSPVATS